MKKQEAGLSDAGGLPEDAWPWVSRSFAGVVLFCD